MKKHFVFEFCFQLLCDTSFFYFINSPTCTMMLQAITVLSEEFGQVLALISQDESLSLSLPDVRCTALEYLQMLHGSAYETLLHAQQIGLSLQNTCTFLMESDEPVRIYIFDVVFRAGTNIRFNRVFVKFCYDSEYPVAKNIRRIYSEIQRLRYLNLICSIW